MDSNTRQRVSSALLTVTLVFALLAVYYALTTGSTSSKAFTQSFVFAIALAGATLGVRFWPERRPLPAGPTPPATSAGTAVSTAPVPFSSEVAGAPLVPFEVVADEERPLHMSDLLVEKMQGRVRTRKGQNGTHNEPTTTAGPEQEWIPTSVAQPEETMPIVDADVDPSVPPRALEAPLVVGVPMSAAPPAPTPTPPTPPSPERAPPVPGSDVTEEEAFRPDPSAPRELLLELASYWHMRFETERERTRALEAKLQEVDRASAPPPAPTPERQKGLLARLMKA